MTDLSLVNMIDEISKSIQDANSSIKFCNVAISSAKNKESEAVKRFAGLAIHYLLESAQRLCCFTGNTKMRNAIRDAEGLK